jgi:hypothetical protein
VNERFFFYSTWQIRKLNLLNAACFVYRHRRLLGTCGVRKKVKSAEIISISDAAWVRERMRFAAALWAHAFIKNASCGSIHDAQHKSLSRAINFGID